MVPRAGLENNWLAPSWQSKQNQFYFQFSASHSNPPELYRPQIYGHHFIPSQIEPQENPLQITTGLCSIQGKARSGFSDGQKVWL